MRVGTTSCPFDIARFSFAAFLLPCGFPPVVPSAINSSSVAISSFPSATSRLPPEAPMAARSTTLPRPGGLLVEDIQFVAGGPEDVLAGENSAAVAGPLGTVGPNVLHPAAVLFLQADPVEPRSAGDQPVARRRPAVRRRPPPQCRFAKESGRWRRRRRRCAGCPAGRPAACRDPTGRDSARAASAARAWPDRRATRGDTG